MGGKWPRVPVSHVATAVIGGTPSRNVAEYWRGDIPWATAKDIAGISGRYLDQVQEFITEEGLENSAAKLLPKGTVVITARGTVGALAQLGRDMAFNQTCYALLPREELDNDFLFYALKGTMTEMHALTYGTVFETITTHTFDQWTIPFPGLPEQRAIAHILGTLDDKIELNRRMNETLEAMARAIFKAWFVDFEPVRAKMEGRWRRGESFPGLPAHLYDLFPERLVDSELGEIPEGWGVRGLDEIAQFLNGLPLQEYPPGNGPTLPVIKIAQLRKGDTQGADRCSAVLPTEYVIDDGDILFSWSGSLECVIWAGGKGGLNQHLFRVTSAHYPKWFCYFWIQEHLPTFRDIAADKATTMGHIQRYHLSESKVFVPHRRLLQAGNDMIAPLLDLALDMRIESRTLASLRDALLPKLISGEIRVRDAEQFLEESGL